MRKVSDYVFEDTYDFDLLFENFELETENTEALKKTQHSQYAGGLPNTLPNVVNGEGKLMENNFNQETLIADDKMAMGQSTTLILTVLRIRKSMARELTTTGHRLHRLYQKVKMLAKRKGNSRFSFATLVLVPSRKRENIVVLGNGMRYKSVVFKFFLVIFAKNRGNSKYLL